MKAQDLINSIKDIYLHQEDYSMQKYVPEFHHNGAFIGDYFNYFIFEPLGELPPRIYHIASPFDLITHKAPQQALVFRDGVVELNVFFSEYADMRSGIQDATVLQLLGVKTLSDKKILFIGSGKIAKWSLTYLKELWPDLTEVDFVNKSLDSSSFASHASALGVSATLKNDYELSLNDIIICHTNTRETILDKDTISKIKRGAIITTYVTSSPCGELASEYFDTTRATVILDWADSLEFAKEVKRARAEQFLNVDEVVYIKDLIEKKQPLTQAQYTVFRSTGTPMQNIGILKLIMKESMNE